MTMRILRRKRLHSHHELVQVLTVLDRIQILIMHTCVHGEQPALNIGMIDHVLQEIESTKHEIVELSEEVSELGYMNPHAYKLLKKTLHEFKHILYDLDKSIRKFLSEMPAGTVNHAPTFDNVKDALKKACPHIKEMYNDLVEDVHEMGLITHDLKSTHTL